jgi:hypothetical protein
MRWGFGVAAPAPLETKGFVLKKNCQKKTPKKKLKKWKGRFFGSPPLALRLF